MNTVLTHPPTVLVLGACGRFGLAAVKAFVAAGWNVVGQHRPERAPAALPGVRWIGVQPSDTAGLLKEVPQAEVVVHAMNPRYIDAVWRREVPALAQAAIAITRALGATLMMPANVYNFGASMPEALREDTPQRASTVKGQIRITTEGLIEEATRDGSMRAVLLRGGDFFGCGQGSWLDLVMVKSLAKGRFTYPGALDVPTAWAYLPDMARALVRVAEERHRLPSFEVLHFGGYRLRGQDWVEALQAMQPAGQALRVSHFPWALLRIVGWFVPMMASLCAMRYLWRTPHYLVNEKLVQLIGPEPHTPFPQALRQALTDLNLGAVSEARPPVQVERAAS